jgi:DNA-binding response OmpR family regulator
MVKPQEQTKKIFYIEKVEFLRSMMEFALKSKGAEVYTVATIEDNFYLLDDLAPDIIIFDVETAQNQMTELLEYSAKALLVAVGSPEAKVLVEDMVKNYLSKPFEARTIADSILSLLD